MRARTRYAPFLYFGRHRAERAAGRAVGPAAATAYNFYQVLDGTLDLQRDDAAWALRPEEGAIVEPGTATSWRGEVRFVHLAFDLVPGARRDVGGAVEIPPGRRPQPAWRELFARDLPPRIDAGYLRASSLLIHRLATTHVRHPLRHLAAHGELAAFVAGWLQVLDATEYGTADEAQGLAERLEVVLMAGYAGGITIAAAARMLGYSPEHLARCYRRQRGKRPTRFLQEWRVLQACSRLRERPDATIAQVAREVGFATPHGLHRCFQAVLGQSPGRWRRRNLPPYTRLPRAEDAGTAGG